MYLRSGRALQAWRNGIDTILYCGCRIGLVCWGQGYVCGCDEALRQGSLDCGETSCWLPLRSPPFIILLLGSLFEKYIIMILTELDITNKR